MKLKILFAAHLLIGSHLCLGETGYNDLGIWDPLYHYLIDYSDVTEGPATLVGQFQSLTEDDSVYSSIKLRQGPGRYNDYDCDLYDNFYLTTQLQISYANDYFSRAQTLTASQTVIAQVEGNEITTLIEQTPFINSNSFRQYEASLLSPFKENTHHIWFPQSHDYATGRIIKVIRQNNSYALHSTCYIRLHEGGTVPKTWVEHPRERASKDKRARIQEEWNEVLNQWENQVAMIDKAYDETVQVLDEIHAQQMQWIDRDHERAKEEALELTEASGIQIAPPAKQPYPQKIRPPEKPTYPEKPIMPPLLDTESKQALNIHSFAVTSEDICKYAEDAAKALEPIYIKTLRSYDGWDYVTAIQLRQYHERGSWYRY